MPSLYYNIFKKFLYQKDNEYELSPTQIKFFKIIVKKLCVLYICKQISNEDEIFVNADINIYFNKNIVKIIDNLISIDSKKRIIINLSKNKPVIALWINTILDFYITYKDYIDNNDILCPKIKDLYLVAKKIGLYYDFTYIQYQLCNNPPTTDIEYEDLDADTIFTYFEGDIII